MANNYNHPSALKIGIVGAGFSGTALASMLHRLSPKQPIEITLFEKTGRFGYGPAYSTPFPHHLLNVRVQDMSPYEDDAKHFMNWLSAQPDLQDYIDDKQGLDQQFVPRCLYARYLQDMLDEMRSSKRNDVKFTCVAREVVDVKVSAEQVELIVNDGGVITVDKVVLALGNNPPSAFPFTIAPSVNQINNPWDYTAVNQISKQEPVLIVGTGLSMIDAVLSLHYQGHEGKIHAVSRHGLLPLRHADGKPAFPLQHDELPENLRPLTRQLRVISEQCISEGGDWRSVINALRLHIPMRWQQMTTNDKKQFLRHVLPYWNIHRHRVHVEIMDLLADLALKQQLVVYAGRVKEITPDAATIKLRHQQATLSLPIRWVINCMGPVQQMKSAQQPLLAALLNQRLAMLDPLSLGFATDAIGALTDSEGKPSSQFFTLGPPTKGTFWECSAVPEIRKQVNDLARHLLR